MGLETRDYGDTGKYYTGKINKKTRYNIKLEQKIRRANLNPLSHMESQGIWSVQWG